MIFTDIFRRFTGDYLEYTWVLFRHEIVALGPEKTYLDCTNENSENCRQLSPDNFRTLIKSTDTLFRLFLHSFRFCYYYYFFTSRHRDIPVIIHLLTGTTSSYSTHFTHKMREKSGWEKIAYEKRKWKYKSNYVRQFEVALLCYLCHKKWLELTISTGFLLSYFHFHRHLRP